MRNECNVCGKCVNLCPQSALELKGAKMSVQDVLDVVLKDLRYYEQSGGGLTLSGGEPLAQFDFTLALLRLAKEKGIHTCIETSGYTDRDRILSVIPYVDLFLYDFKLSDDDEHKKSTGVSQNLILDNLLAINEAGAKIVLRCPIIPTYNDNDEHLKAISATANTLHNVIEINIMPYHPMGASKAVRIGQEYPISHIGFPSDEQIENWVKIVKREADVAVKIG